MKTIFIILIFLIFNFLFPAEEEGKPNQDIWKDFSIIKKTIPVPENIKTGFDSIKKNEAAAYLKFLSSDLLEGRDTATRSFDIASDFVATMFSLWSIKPAGDFSSRSQHLHFTGMEERKNPDRSYFQEVDMKEVIKTRGKITVGYSRGSQTKTRIFYPEIDYSYFSRETESITAPVIFVGYGISEKQLNFDEYKGIKVKNKIVMMLTEVPCQNDPESPFNQGVFKEKYNPVRRMHRHISPKVKLAKERGAIAVLLVENSPKKKGDVANKILDSKIVDDEKPIFSRSRRRLSLIKSSESMPWEKSSCIRISRELADAILNFSGLTIKKAKAQIEKDLKPQSRELRGVTLTLDNTADTRLVRSRNVLGFIEGSDPGLKDEVVVIGAHLDHLGRKGDYIFNGADDNGSGSVAVMEIAEAFSKNKLKPKRSVVFALWTGEEVGLLGSRYFVENPVFPLKKTVACLNLDMISREWTLQNLKRINKMWRLGISDTVLGEINLDDFVTLVMDADSQS
ncbi:MAG: M20/M25/M40 family metallo-hydrolase, partial [Candidatus Aminicenantes bacterium]|nr:M20/M25/M40 family metallo-hydrolase [Candidatus Aminicenantes bacterium]